MAINDMIKSDYFDKDVDFSASDFTIPTYQLWVKKNCKKNEDAKQGLAAWVGQLVHDASYNHPEVGVIKEFSATREMYLGDQEYATIGGSIDRVEYLSQGLWQIADIKTMGMYPAKKAFKDSKNEWVAQLSVYAWLLADYDISCETIGIIHQYVMGFQKNKDGMNDYNKLEVALMSLEDTEEMIRNKIDIATGDEPIYKDCESWRCASYCDWNKSCPSYNKGE